MLFREVRQALWRWLARHPRHTLAGKDTIAGIWSGVDLLCHLKPRRERETSPFRMFQRKAFSDPVPLEKTRTRKTLMRPLRTDLRLDLLLRCLKLD